MSAELSKDGKTLYVANLGGANVAIVDVSDPSRPTVTATLATDPHPNDIVLTADGRLFVSCGNTNNVISFDLKTSQRLEVINTALGPKAPAGSTPNSLALSPDGERLYVANADNNSVAVIDVEERGKSQAARLPADRLVPDLRHDDGRRQAHHRRQRQRQRHRAQSRQAADRSDRAGRQLPAPRQPAQRPGLVHRYARREEARRIHEAGLRQRALSGHAARDVRRRRRVGDSDQGRRAVADQARALHHEREPHLRSGVRRSEAGQRRSEPDAVRPRRDAEPARAGGAVRPARQPLLQRRSLAGRPALDDVGVRERIHAARLDAQLLAPRQRQHRRRHRASSPRPTSGSSRGRRA